LRRWWSVESDHAAGLRFRDQGQSDDAKSESSAA
jgi:hypothetical protein